MKQTTFPCYAAERPTTLMVRYHSRPSVTPAALYTTLMWPGMLPYHLPLLNTPVQGPHPSWDVHQLLLWRESQMQSKQGILNVDTTRSFKIYQENP